MARRPAPPSVPVMPEDTPPDQAWELALDGHTHRVEVRGSVSRRLQWHVDGELVAEKKTTDDKVQLSDEARPELGVVGVRFSGLGRPRRATLFEHDPTKDLDASARALAGLGGLDLGPEPGSPAARHEDQVRAHPQRYALVAGLTGVAKVVVPLLLAALVARLAVSIPWPDLDLPDIPWPDLPSIPWPDLPSVPWPDLPSIPWPDWSLPGWLVWLLDHAHYVVPVIVALVLARNEIRRRAKQDELRAARLRERENSPEA
jgi:hypothetical protein